MHLFPSPSRNTLPSSPNSPPATPRAPRIRTVELPSAGPSYINPHIDSSSRRFLISLDLSIPPSSMSTILRNHASRTLLDQQAIEPLLPSITVIIRETGFLVEWSVITVRAKDEYFVTIRDVLECVSNSLHQQISPNDYMRLPTALSRQLVLESYERRCREYNDRMTQGEEMALGPKRIDWLLGRTTFSGLMRLAGQDPDVWRVVLS
ncbi:hypothetical protein AX16_007571 [Volvariella volvacea WC 439]|nr:hypothetical protein AX16_007571 [Volvariella volvacea WC 439]